MPGINLGAIAFRAVAVAVAVIVGAPCIYYSFIIGGDLGSKASLHSHGVVPEHVAFLGGSIVAGAATVFAIGFLAVAAARLVACAFSVGERR
jgi:hypothetical protein